MLEYALEKRGKAREEPGCDNAKADQSDAVVFPDSNGATAHPGLGWILCLLAGGGKHSHEARQEKKAFGRTEEAEALVKIVGYGLSEMVQGHLQKQEASD